MTGPEPLIPASVRPYDLTAPSRLLIPGPPHHHTWDRVREIPFGSDGAVIEVRTWGRCRAACSGGQPGGAHHEPGRSVRVRVPCDSLPHCTACECGDAHDEIMTPDQVTALLDALS